MDTDLREHVGAQSGSDVVSQDLHGVGPAKYLLRTRHHLVFGRVRYRHGHMRGGRHRHTWQYRRCWMQVREHFDRIVGFSVFISLYSLFVLIRVKSWNKYFLPIHSCDKLDMNCDQCVCVCVCVSATSPTS